jgi:septal ring factor EnvC (AmiA/AmiB activator)
MGLGNIDPDDVAKAAERSGFIAMLIAFLFGRRKAKQDREKRDIDNIRVEVSTLRDIIKEWKDTAMSALTENKELKLEVAVLRTEVYQLRMEINNLKNGGKR